MSAASRSLKCYKHFKNSKTVVPFGGIGKCSSDSLRFPLSGIAASIHVLSVGYCGIATEGIEAFEVELAVGIPSVVKWRIYRTRRDFALLDEALRRVFGDGFMPAPVGTRGFRGDFNMIDWDDANCEDVEGFLTSICSSSEVLATDHFQVFVELSRRSMILFDEASRSGAGRKKDALLKRIEGPALVKPDGSKATGGSWPSALRCGQWTMVWLTLERDGFVVGRPRIGDEDAAEDALLFDTETRVEYGRSHGRGKAAAGLKISTAETVLRVDLGSTLNLQLWLRSIDQSLRECPWTSDLSTLLFYHFSFVGKHRGLCCAEVLEALEGAQSCIWIQGWWLTPTLDLGNRDSEEDTQRLCDVLKLKAEQGVSIRILVYKEIPLALSNASGIAKEFLNSLHPNIQVSRHPHHHFTPSGHTALFWSHHSKVVIVDQTWRGFVGGLDLAKGRWDTSSHPVTDSGHQQGSEYYNPTLRDCPRGADAEYLDRSTEPRMPWHDVAVELLGGEAVLDLARHFAQLWNHVHTSGVLATPTQHPEDPLQNVHNLECSPSSAVGGAFAVSGDHSAEVLQKLASCEFGVATSSTRSLNLDHEAGWRSGSLRTVSEGSTLRSDDMLENFPDDELDELDCEVQVLRSGGRWSLGVNTENSIYSAYLHLIEQSKRFIYIENQFMVSSVGEYSPVGQESRSVANLIAEALARRIIRAAEEGDRQFRVYVVIPSAPAMPCDDWQSTSSYACRMTLALQLKTIAQGQHSLRFILNQRLLKLPDYQGLDEPWTEHIAFFSLRGAGVLPNGKLVTEQIYIHSKMMIVDDERFIVGSANINDRSMVGTRDSEMAVLVEKPQLAKKMRVALWREHLGVPVDESSDLEIKLQDPQSNDCWGTWKELASENSCVFREYFPGLVPDSEIRDGEDYTAAKLASTNSRLGEMPTNREVSSSMPLRGHVVEFPKDFMRDDDLSKPGLPIEPPEYMFA
ncbi:Phospholipase D [Perkinsus chesapeaki]|uniref:phospholipase D n=1 Tax=Perkinsus chesapeaki TaxID=330153 RepID=A0A7J6MQM5_PERCH|nr:Phospholipase D [Perkinsus chesapeaki]